MFGCTPVAQKRCMSDVENTFVVQKIAALKNVFIHNINFKNINENKSKEICLCESINILCKI